MKRHEVTGEKMGRCGDCKGLFVANDMHGEFDGPLEYYTCIDCLPGYEARRDKWFLDKHKYLAHKYPEARCEVCGDGWDSKTLDHTDPFLKKSWMCVEHFDEFVSNNIAKVSKGRVLNYKRDRVNEVIWFKS